MLCCCFMVGSLCFWMNWVLLDISIFRKKNVRITGCSTACLVLDPTLLVLFAFINVKRYCGLFAVSIILKDLVIMFKTGIIGY